MSLTIPEFEQELQADEDVYLGGETPIISGLGLVKALQEQAPEFVEKLQAKGVKYVYRYGVEKIVSTTGASIFDAYGQHVNPEDDEKTARKKMEQEVRRHSNNFEWHDDGSLSVTHVVPSMHFHQMDPPNLASPVLDTYILIFIFFCSH